MAMTLLNQLFFIRGARHSPLLEIAGVGAEAHRAAVFIVGEMFFLLQHHINHRVGGTLLNLGRVRILQSEHVARIFNHHELHAIAEAEIGNLLFARELYRFNLPLDAAFAEAAGDDDAVIF